MGILCRTGSSCDRRSYSIRSNEPQCLRASERDVRVESGRLAVVQAKIGESRHQAVERDSPRFQLAKCGPESGMRPLAERQRTLRTLTTHVESVRIGKGPWVAIGGREPHEQIGALGQGDPTPRRHCNEEHARDTPGDALS